MKPTFTLSSDEEALLSKIDFSAPKRDSCDAASKLVRLLIARRAIPPARLKYFFDDEYGERGKSRKLRFESNARPGVDISAHPHFVKYLRYFLYGPDLPSDLISVFTARVDQEDFISGSDIDELLGIVSQGARRQDVIATDAPEEFLKLAVQCGLDADLCQQIRNRAKRVRAAQRR